MKFCKKCSLEFKDNAKFCPKCGSPLVDKLETPESMSTEEIAAQLMQTLRADLVKNKAILNVKNIRIGDDNIDFYKDQLDTADTIISTIETMLSGDGQSYRLSANDRRDLEKMNALYRQCRNQYSIAMFKYKLQTKMPTGLYEVLYRGKSADDYYQFTLDYQTIRKDYKNIKQLATEFGIDIHADEHLKKFVTELETILKAMGGDEAINIDAPWEKALEEGNDACQKVDGEKAKRCYEEAARLGSGEAMYQLGCMYDNEWEGYKSAGFSHNTNYWKQFVGAVEGERVDGKKVGLPGEYKPLELKYPVAKDHEKALMWYQKAATRFGSNKAMYKLGMLHENLDERFKWLKKAALHGSHKALWELQQLGIVFKNEVERKRWSKMSTYDGFLDEYGRLKRELASMPEPTMPGSQQNKVSESESGKSTVEEKSVNEVKNDADSIIAAKNAELQAEVRKKRKESEKTGRIFGFTVLITPLIYIFTSSGFFDSIAIAFVAALVLAEFADKD